MLMSFWNSVTEPQAIIVSTLLTMIAGLVAIVIGSRFFQGKVATLEQAMATASGQIEQHIRNLEKALAEIEELAITSSERLAAISGREANGEANGALRLEPDRPDGKRGPLTPSDRLRAAWETVRDAIEAQASDRSIDPRRRAKYSRIDRRNYADLVKAMSEDGEIRGPRNLAEEWKKAIALRYSFRNGQRKPTDADAAEMERIAALV
ncbi:MAG: hypothetical protein N2Z62_02175 [Rhodobacteraceae bacterium]|nr:hypothetical protein [Paracoccaceae bacterium]